MSTDISIATDSTLATKCLNGYLGIIQNWVRGDGGVMQKEADNKITSEGTGYVGDFAVLCRDRTTLDLIESFRMNVLQRKNWTTSSSQQWRHDTANQPTVYAPNLHAWDYRIAAFGGNPANTVNDWNWASDAEVDIFKYLWKASWIWPDGPYLARALEILSDLKKYAFVPYGGGYLQTTDEFQNRVELEFGTLASFRVIGPGHHLWTSRYQSEINPSYIDFDFYKAGKQSTNDAFWDSCEVGAKAFLLQVTQSTGSLPTSVGLAPDWCGVDQDGTAYQIQNGVRGWAYDRVIDHKYDAFRTEHRLAEAWRHYRDPDYATILTPLANHYIAEWAANGKIAAEQSHTGTALSGGYEKPMMTFGAVFAIEAVYGKSHATAIAIRSGKLNSTTRQSTDVDGNKFWNDTVGGPENYFTDMWMEFSYMADCGLQVNYGQKVVATGQLSAQIIDDGTSQDVYDLTFSDDLPPPPPTPGTIDCEQWYWISRSGITIDLSKFIDGVEAMAAIEGRGEPSLRQTTIIVPGEPGQFTTDVQHGPREINFPLHASGRRLDMFGDLPTYADPEELENVLVGLIKAMDPVGDGSSPESGVGILRLIRRNGAVFDLSGRVMTDGLRVRQNTHHLGFEQLALAIICDDPYWYSESVTIPFYGSVARSWFPMIRAGQPWLSSSAILGNVNFIVNSDVPTDPIWTAYGPGTTPIITNLDNPTETIQFKDTLPALGSAQTMVIDTREGTVTGPNGEDWFSYLKPGSRNMFQLRPGENNIAMDLVGAIATSYIGVTYRNKQVVPR